MDPNKLNGFEKDQVIRLLMHHMGMDLRGELMRTLPQAYNKMMGKDFLTVVHPGRPADEHNDKIDPHPI